MNTPATVPVATGPQPDRATNSAPLRPSDDAAPGFVGRWVSTRFAAYGRACLLTAVFLTPIVVDVGASDAFALVKLTVLWCLGVLAIACAVALAGSRSRRDGSMRIQWATLAFLAVCGVTTAFSTSPRVSILGLPGRYGGLIPILLYAGMMLACIRLYRDQPSRLREIAWAIVAASSIVSAYVCIQAAGLDPAHWTDPSTSLRPDWPVGTLGNSNFAGGYLAIALPFSLYAALTRRRVAARLAFAMLAGVQLLALWYTQTRGGMIAAGFALVTMAHLGRRLLPRWLRVATAGAVAVAVAGAVMVIWHPGFDRAPGVLDRVRTSTLESRLAFWRVGVDVALDHPLVGTGLDTFYAQYPKGRSASAAKVQGLTLPDKPHNIFIEYAANTGVFGLASYLALVIGAILLARRTLKRNQAAPDLLLLAFLGALVAYLVQGFFSIDEPPLAIMGWICIGGIAVLARAADVPPNAPDHDTAPTSVARRTAVYGGVAIAAAGLLVVGAQPLRASAAAGAGDLDRATRLQPFDPSYPKRAGDLNRLIALATPDRTLRRSHLQAADRYYRAALRLQPGELDLLLKMAVTNSIWADSVDPTRFTEAEYWWTQARRADPHDPELLAEYVDSLNVMRGRAGELGQLALADPGNADAWVAAAQASVALGDLQATRDRVARALAVDPNNDAARRLANALPS